MFGFLKKKISDFVSGLSKKEDSKSPEITPAKEAQEEPKQDVGISAVPKPSQPQADIKPQTAAPLKIPDSKADIKTEEKKPEPRHEPAKKEHVQEKPAEKQHAHIKKEEEPAVQKAQEKPAEAKPHAHIKEAQAPVKPAAKEHAHEKQTHVQPIMAHEKKSEAPDNREIEIPVQKEIEKSAQKEIKVAPEPAIAHKPIVKSAVIQKPEHKPAIIQKSEPEIKKIQTPEPKIIIQQKQEPEIKIIQTPEPKIIIQQKQEPEIKIIQAPEPKPAPAITQKQEEKSHVAHKAEPKPVPAHKPEMHMHEKAHGEKAHVKKQHGMEGVLESTTPAPDLSRLGKKAGDENRAIKPKLNLVSTITSIFSDQVTIKESDVSELLDMLELSLLEGDVAFEVATEIVQSIKGRLVGAKVPKGKFSDSIKNAIRTSLVEVMTSAGEYDLFSKADESKKPFKILFVGPNGAGKTTTMAKVANAFMKDGKTVVFAACDTFRAAAIEQLEVHAQRLGIKVIKNQYGSDPTSVAFDAVKHAQSNNIDIVLIDSSGRQDTNANLIAELKKMERVVKPDANVYIGESIAGNAVISQVTAFKEAIGIQGVILTKLDCDPKGGSAISITKATGVPIIFVGTGQKYEDIKKFNAEEIADEMVEAG